MKTDRVTGKWNSYKLRRPANLRMEEAREEFLLEASDSSVLL